MVRLQSTIQLRIPSGPNKEGASVMHSLLPFSSTSETSPQTLPLPLQTPHHLLTSYNSRCSAPHTLPHTSPPPALFPVQQLCRALAGAPPLSSLRPEPAHAPRAEMSISLAGYLFPLAAYATHCFLFVI